MVCCYLIIRMVVLHDLRWVPWGLSSHIFEMERIILAILQVVVKFQHVTEVSPSCLWHANAHSPSQPSSHWSSHPQGGSRELVASLCYRWGNEIPEQGHGFSKAMQLISNGTRSRSQASWLPAPYVFNSRDRLRKKPVQILACPHMGQEAKSTCPYPVIPTALMDLILVLSPQCLCLPAHSMCPLHRSSERSASPSGALRGQMCPDPQSSCARWTWTRYLCLHRVPLR